MSTTAGRVSGSRASGGTMTGFGGRAAFAGAAAAFALGAPDLADAPVVPALALAAGREVFGRGVTDAAAGSVGPVGSVGSFDWSVIDGTS